MKSLILVLSLVLGPVAMAASTVSVIVDGQAFSCSGGSGGGSTNQCECSPYQTGSGSQWGWKAYKRGSETASGYCGTSNSNYCETYEAALNSCKAQIVSNSNCYN